MGAGCSRTVPSDSAPWCHLLCRPSRPLALPSLIRLPPSFIYSPAGHVLQLVILYLDRPLEVRCRFRSLIIPSDLPNTRLYRLLMESVRGEVIEWSAMSTFKIPSVRQSINCHCDYNRLLFSTSCNLTANNLPSPTTTPTPASFPRTALPPRSPSSSRSTLRSYPPPLLPRSAKQGCGSTIFPVAAAATCVLSFGSARSNAPA
ncbi:hypothetical protein FIBSPDRAFT_422296 [Athelia psychrophila]|uniref:Uncharacterized protein n=1 Tax=Athelia psychrophila TaxID=1759441 RepID=A0A166MWE4_9AGAM|nr:hypothetical protein FIBSPDRAFT_422296 [Fibularhizoctonia sp. CBS 109695]